MKYYYIIICLCLICACSRKHQENDFLTYYEKSKFLETPRYKETIEYCKKLAGASDRLKYTTVGISPQGLELPLLIADKDGAFDINSVRAGKKSVIMIQACIHPGEPEGKDAGMMLLRDIAVLKKCPELLDHVTILFIPIFNVDGHERFSAFNRINQNGPKETGWRTTAKNLNLNRDFLKADAPEMKHWLKLYNKWLPEFLIDCHTTDGADYQYTITYGIEINGNTEEKLTRWMRDVYLKGIEKQMLEKNILIFPYVGFRNWHDPRSGLESWVAPPMLSGGYVAIQNRASLLIETHMLKNYQTRVNATYEILKQSLILLNREYKNLNQLVKNADEYTASQAFREKEFPLAFTSSGDSTIVTFKGKEYTAIKSELTGGEWFQFSDKPADMQIPYFNKQKISVAVKLPEGYIIPQEWAELIERLDLHGIKYSKLKEPKKIMVSSYKFKNVKFSAASYEGRQRLQSFDTDEIKEERMYPKGSAVIDMNQRTARVIAHILEPKAYDSFLNWGFFNSIFEQKEYGESYIMEKVAREMIASNKNLKSEFEKMKAEDKNFANDPWAMLNWFYNQSPFRDMHKDIYPVGRINDRKDVERLIK
ncbi:MAG: M14 family metallopeptidase [Bacteroidia bacterium]|nr:M14 family metallopeptidase [Bacteroidia bacterium]